MLAIVIRRVREQSDVDKALIGASEVHKASVPIKIESKLQIFLHLNALIESVVKIQTYLL